MSTIRFACVIAATSMVWSACGGGGGEEQTTTAETTAGSEAPPEPEPPPPPRPVPVRLLHLAAGAADTPASAQAGTAQVTDVAFKSASAYAEVTPPAEQGVVPVQVTAGGATATLEAPYRAGTPATLIVLTNPQDPTQIVLTATEDDPTTVTGQMRGRFVNALLGTETIDFCLPGDRPRDPGSPIFTGVQYGTVAGTELPNHYIPISMASGARIQIRAGAERGCTGRVIGTAEVPPPDPNIAHNFTIAVVGRASGRPAVARELLVCEDAPNQSACAAFPLR